jgi:exodeoxyribonuclease V alpha subunit
MTPAMNATQQETTVTGTVKKITFINPETSFTIFKLDTTSGTMSVKGEFPGLKIGHTLSVSGIVEIDKKWGAQMKASAYSQVDPEGNNAIAKYLCLNVDLIGPIYARKIVDKFGADTFKILDETPERLHEISGVGDKRVEEVIKVWKDQRGIRKVLEFFTRIGVSPGFAIKFWDTYGDQTIAMIQADPYRLARDVDGIGFKKADEYALNMGIPEHSPQRLMAAIEHTLGESQSSGGNCFEYGHKLVDGVVKLLANPKSPAFINQGMIQSALIDGVRRQLLIAEQDRIYLPDTYEAELYVANKLRMMMQLPLPQAIQNEKGKILIAEAISKLPFVPAETQKDAARLLIGAKVGVLTGGPGTGKTSITQVLVAAYKKAGIQITLLAPTGRAGKRMGEVIGMPAATIHRDLFTRDKKIRDGEITRDQAMIDGVVFIDEASMVDIKLAKWLLTYIRDTAILIIVGDKDQLPSVGPGAVLRDLIASTVVPVAHLTQIFRQASGSNICTAAADINAGRTPYLPLFGKEHGMPDSDFLVVMKDDAEEQVAAAIWCASVLSRQLGFDPKRECQVMAPMRKGAVGIDNLNLVLQRTLNPNPTTYIDRNFGGKWGVGDKVMQIKNNYELGVLNGDVGIIEFMNKTDEGKLESLVVNYDGSRITYEPKHFEGLVLAYACSIHKMQGSESPMVIILLHNSHYMLLQRTLAYTGITRGKKKVVLICSGEALSRAIRNNEVSKRNSYLAEKLKGAA